MSAAEECRAQILRLRARIRELRAEMETCTDLSRREVIRDKIKSYRGSIRDLQDQLDHLETPEQRSRPVRGRTIATDSFTFDFFEYSGTCWSDLEGHSWNQLQSMDFVNVGVGSAEFYDWVAQGATRLSAKQRVYLDGYYNEGLSMQAIAERHGVTISAVSRVIHSGLTRMEKWVEACQLAQACIRPNGLFDWTTFLAQCPVLTDRQKQMLLLALSKAPRSQADLANHLELSPCSVSRTLALGAKTIRSLHLRGGAPVAQPEIPDWEAADKYSLALAAGMPLAFYYRYCFAGQRVGGLTRYMYEIFRRREAGRTVAEIAQELGVRSRTIRGAFSRLNRQKIALDNNDCIGINLDAETYCKLQRMAIGGVDP